MKEIPLSKTGKCAGRYVALVDDEDYEKANQYNWSARISKYTQYAQRKAKDGEFTSLHRLIMDIKDPSILIDHEDHNGLNCQKHNMRIATRAQNNCNRQPAPNSSSVYMGVSLSKQKYKDKIYYSWKAQIKANGKVRQIGRFEEEVLAALAYDNEAKIVHGNFANLNFK